MKKFANQTEHAFYEFMLYKGMTEPDAERDIRILRELEKMFMPVERYYQHYLAEFESGAKPDSTGAYTLALKRFRAFMRYRAKGDPMALLLKDFIGKVVVKTCNQKRYTLEQLNAAQIGVKSLEPESGGYHAHYSYPTINGDPFTQGYLVFEDPSLAEHFARVYDAHCRSQDGYWENYEYWMHRD